MRKVVKIALIVFIVYILITRGLDDVRSWITRENTDLSTINNPTTSASPIEASTTDDFEGNFIERSLSKIVANVLKTEQGKDAFKKLVHPVNQNNLPNNNLCLGSLNLVKKIFDIKDVRTLPDANGPAYCGQTVTIKYVISDENDKSVIEEEKNITLGAKKTSDAIENIVVGMHVGEIREAVVSSYHLKTSDINIQNTSRAYKVQITLNDIDPAIKIPSHEIRIWDQNEEYHAPPCLCGQKINFDVRISKLDGTVIYDTNVNERKIEMLIGDNYYPMIFSYALFNKIPSGQRTVLTKGKYLNIPSQDEGNKFLQELNLQINSDEFFILEFFNFTVVNNGE